MNFKHHELYKIVFLDHACYGSECLRCEIVGYFIRETDTHLTFSHWLSFDLDNTIDEDNYEYTHIVKAAIEEMHDLGAKELDDFAEE